MDEDRIRDRAYAIWEREGCPDGRHEAHWEQARRELLDEERRAREHRVRALADAGDFGPDDLLHPSGRNSGGI
ncbi:DUF2934 domain-containing protein [Azospirillum sp. TSO22-1]|uniref:DUF2934 domain-containing protein n=1 Tax=Azospirillum sp. TSO22-1 TaxID=716789 RepID=UPI000D61A0AD|nr:DUF2934 domain-containing protein [Azospirillum sp. TSO22-1]PWC43060.1 hypothetical protein TSO221_20215 [Azospirillum sp. TSO22-1]